MRIKELLGKDEVWDAEKVANMQTDDVATVSPKLAKLMLSEIPDSVLKANDNSRKSLHQIEQLGRRTPVSFFGANHLLQIPIPHAQKHDAR